MSGVELNDDGEVLNGVLYFVQLLVGAADEIIGIDVAAVDIEQGVAVLNGIQILVLLHVGAGPDEEGLLVIGVRFQFQTAN